MMKPGYRVVHVSEISDVKSACVGYPFEVPPVSLCLLKKESEFDSGCDTCRVHVGGQFESTGHGFVRVKEDLLRSIRTRSYFK